MKFPSTKGTAPPPPMSIFSLSVGQLGFGCAPRGFGLSGPRRRKASYLSAIWASGCQARSSLQCICDEATSCNCRRNRKSPRSLVDRLIFARMRDYLIIRINLPHNGVQKTHTWLWGFVHAVVYRGIFTALCCALCAGHRDVITWYNNMGPLLGITYQLP